MRRVLSTARPDYTVRCDEVGFYHHSSPPMLGFISGDTEATEPSRLTEPYWWEDAYYELTVTEAETLGEAAETSAALMHETLLEVAADERKFAKLLLTEGFPGETSEMLRASILAGDAGLTVRMRLAWDPTLVGSRPVLLNVYAGSAFGMAEQQAQQSWSSDTFLISKQFAALDTSLISVIRERYRDEIGTGQKLHLLVTGEADPNRELLSALIYIHGRATEAGFTCVPVLWNAVSYHDGAWWDQYGEKILLAYSLLPFPYLYAHGEGSHLLSSSLPFVEPAWWGLLNSNLLLAAAWNRDPSHPNLLPTLLGDKTGEQAVASDTPPSVFPLSRTAGDTLVTQQAAPYRRYGSRGEYRPEYDVWCVWDQGEPTAVALSMHEYEETLGGLRYYAVPHQIAEEA